MLASFMCMGKDAGAAASYKLTIGSLHAIIGN